MAKKRVVRRRLVNDDSSQSAEVPQSQRVDSDAPEERLGARDEPGEDEPSRESRSTAPAAPRRTAKAARTTSRRLTRSTAPESDGGAYDITGDLEDSRVHRFHSGCTLLDCVMGGGDGGAYPEGRIVNFCGWNSTGKTQVCIEAAANFAKEYANGWIRYNEAEAAFDRAYAKQIGLPLDRVEFAEDCFTVEDVFKDMERCLERANGRPGLYILDSLDALSDEAELARDVDKGSYGANKAKKMSELFRKLVKKMSNAKVTIIIVSQLRDKLNVSFGEKATRAGGRGLDFYASWIAWLAHVGQIKKTINGVERVIGVRIKVKNKKNKCGPPFRDAEFIIYFNYGIDDIESCVDWLVDIKKWAEFDDRKPGAYLKWLDRQTQEVYRQEGARLSAKVRSEWNQIEASFTPKFTKY